MAEHLSAVEVDPQGAPEAAVVLLHGLGADGHDFEPIVPELGLPLPVRWVFPHAPVRPVTINGGMRMRAWYDVTGFGPGAPVDEAGIRESGAAVRSLLLREGERGLPASRIVLAGFSQGGVLALHAGLRHPAPLAGVVALSAYLPLSRSLADEAHAVNRAVPIFMAHGREDPVVPFAAGQRALERLQGHGYAVEWHDYAIGHTVSAEEIADLGRWLRRVLPQGA